MAKYIKFEDVIGIMDNNSSDISLGGTTFRVIDGVGMFEELLELEAVEISEEDTVKKEETLDEPSLDVQPENILHFPKK